MPGKRNIIIIWGGYPPVSGGGSVQLYRILPYLSSLFDIVVFTRGIRGRKDPETRTNKGSVSIIRVPPLEPNLPYNKNLRFYLTAMLNVFNVHLRMLCLYPLLTYHCLRRRPSIIVKEATTWDFGRNLNKLPFRLPWKFPSPWNFAANTFKIPLYIYFTNLWYYREDADYIRTTMQGASKIVVVDTWIGEYLKDTFSLDEVTYVPVSVNIQDFERNNTSTNEVPNRILYVARLAPERGCDVLLRAIPIIRKAIPNICVDIVGDGFERQKLIQMSKDLGIEECIRFVGNVDQSKIQEVYDNTKVYINPLRVPGIGTSTLEALASGIPVIKAKIEDWSNDPIIDGENGYSFNVDDHNDLADRIITVLSMRDDTWRRMSEKARRSAQPYDILENQKDWANLLN